MLLVDFSNSNFVCGIMEKLYKLFKAVNLLGFFPDFCFEAMHRLEKKCPGQRDLISPVPIMTSTGFKILLHYFTFLNVVRHIGGSLRKARYKFLDRHT